MASPQLLILYATETGTAEDIAFSIHSRLSPTYARCCVSDVKEYDFMENLPAESFVVFVVSTTGEGEVPVSMKDFWSFLLRRNLPSNSLANLSFTIFGLGDSSYDKFNATARRLNVRLKQLGAKEIVPLGLGDDQARYGYFTALNDWFDNLFRYTSIYLEKKPPSVATAIEATTYTVGITPINPSTPPSDPNDDIKSVMNYFIHPQSSSSASSSSSSLAPAPSNHSTKTYLCTTELNERMTSYDWNQDVRHLRFSLPADLPTKSLQYDVGDIAEVYYCTSPALVQKARAIMCPNCALTDTIVVEQRVGSVRRPSRLRGRVQCSLDTLLSR